MRNINLEMPNTTSNYSRTEFFKNWFTKRGLKIVEYQQDILSNKLTFNGEPMVLAVSPGGGKTVMSIAAIDKYCLDNPTHKVLVLTHGQTILRSQYAETIYKNKPNFTMATIVRCLDQDSDIPQVRSVEIETSKVQVLISLPQSIHTKSLPHFDLVVVDEAHQFYFAEMVQSILKQVCPQHELLLTGTPSPFIRRKFKIIAVSLETLYDYGMVSDPIIELASSSYYFTEADYSYVDELKGKVKIRQEDTDSTLDSLLEQISLKTNSSVSNNWNDVLKALSKTMIVCKSIEQAQNVKSFFEKEKVNIALSTSDTDRDSTEIERFIKNAECMILVVCERGILGFNYPDLINIIDMSCSRNIDRIFQLFCRVVRKSKSELQKTFLKVVPQGMEESFELVMEAVCSLIHHDNFIQYDGTNLLDIKIPVIKINENNITKDRKGNKANETDKKKRERIYKPLNFIGSPVFKFFKPIFSDKNNVLTPYAFTTLREIREKNNDWSRISKEEFFDRCHKEFVKNNCIIITDLRKSFYNGYGALIRNSWVDDFCKTYRIRKARISWGNMSKDERFHFIYQKYVDHQCTKITNLYSYYSAGYNYLLKNKYLDEFCTIYKIERPHDAVRNMSGSEIFSLSCRMFKEQNCQTVNSFRKVFRTGYDFIKKNNLYNDFKKEVGL